MEWFVTFWGYPLAVGWASLDWIMAEAYALLDWFGWGPGTCVGYIDYSGIAHYIACR